MSAPEVVAPVAIHWEVRGAAQPTALSPASSPPPCPAMLRADGMTPASPVTSVGAGLTGVADVEVQAVAAATLLVSKGSTIPAGQASRIWEGWALSAVPATSDGLGLTHRDADARSARAHPAPTPHVRVRILDAIIATSSRIGRWRRPR